MNPLRLSLLLLMAAALPVRASVSELVPRLASTNLAERSQAQMALFKESSYAGRPGAEAERAAYCEALCTALSNSCPPVVAVQLVRQIQRIGDDESVDTLQRLLEHPDRNFRDDVRRALETNPSPRASEVLMGAWQQSEDDLWTLGLINALGQRREPRAVEPLSGALQHSNSRVAAAAAGALARIPSREAAVALHRALSPTRPDVAAGMLMLAHEAAKRGDRSLAARLYHSLNKEPLPADTRLSAWIGLLTAMPNKAAELATPLSDPVVLHAAIEASTQMKNGALTDRIAGQLASASSSDQLRILAALEAGGDSKYASAVAQLLGAENQDVANLAFQTLGVIGTSAELTALLEDDRGIEPLSKIADSGIDNALALRAAKGHPDQRIRAIKIMGLRGTPEIASQLLGYARDPDASVAAAGLTALEQVATVEELPAVTAIMLGTESSSLARAALGVVIAVNRNTSQPEQAAQILLDELPAASGKGKSLLFRAFTQIGSDVTLANVLVALASEEAELRAAGLKALSAWPNPNAIDPMLEAASDASLETKDHVLIMRGLGRLLSEDKRVDLDRCAKALQVARRPEEKKLFISILGTSKQQDALALIEPYLTDADLMEEAKLAAKAVAARKR